MKIIEDKILLHCVPITVGLAQKLNDILRGNDAPKIRFIGCCFARHHNFKPMETTEEDAPYN